jgi:hypothetical protein
MGAELGVQSALGQGAEFTLRLPSATGRQPSVLDLVR